MSQRQLRGDDTSVWPYKFGSGSDGDLTISSHTTEAPIDSSCTATAGTTSISATNASFAAGQFILIHKTRGNTTTANGNWELNKIASYSAGTITTELPMIYSYQDSGADQSQVRVLKQYNNVTINSGINYSTKNWNQNVGGIIGWFALNTTITGNVFAKGNAASGGTPGSGAGFRGGATRGNYGEGDAKDTGAGSDSTCSAGGGGASDGGGNGGNGVQGAGGSAGWGEGGHVTGNAGLTLMSFGGGGGSTRSSAPEDAAGGASGGIIAIFSKILTVTGSVSAVGGAGQWVAAGRFGGGGSGGSILLKFQKGTLGSNLITAAGNGNGATGTADGRIHIDYGQTYTGTTTPTADARLDGSLNDAGGAFLYNFV